MSRYAIVRHDEQLTDEVDMEERVRMLEDRLRAMEQTVAGWQDQTVGVFEAADRLRDQLARARDARELPEQVDETMTEIRAPVEAPIVVEPKYVPPPPARSPVSTWLLLDLIADVKDIISLTFDSGYQRSWTLSLASPALVVGFVSIYFFFDFFIIGDILKLSLALVLFKVLNREVVRYRDHLRRRVNL